MKYQTCQDHFDNLTSFRGYKSISFGNTSYEGPLQMWKEFGYSDYIKIFICGVIMIVGSLGNLSIILTVGLNKSMRNNINFYIANLAVADFIVCSICVVPHAIKEMTLKDHYPLGEVMCKFNPYIQKVCLITSVLTLSAISCDRSMAILFPLRRRVTKQRPYIVMIVVWIIAILLSTPIFLFKEHHTEKWQNFTLYKCKTEWSSKIFDEESEEFCIRDNPLHVVYTIVLTITLFFLPVFIMITAYFLILLKLRVAKAPGEQYDAIVSMKSRARRKVNKMVFIVLVVFIICWLPLEGLYLYSIRYKPKMHFEPPKRVPKLKWFLECIAFANSVFNPMIYGWYNKTFRDGFCVLLTCGYKSNAYRLRGRSRGAGNTSNSDDTSFVQPLRRVSTTLSTTLGNQSHALFKHKANIPIQQENLEKETNL